MQATDGAFYGTTVGGIFSPGTVYRLDVGLDPFVETRPALGKITAAVQILGTNLTGVTSVSFNGTAASFAEVSKSLLTTTVLAGQKKGTPPSVI